MSAKHVRPTSKISIFIRFVQWPLGIVLGILSLYALAYAAKVLFGISPLDWGLFDRFPAIGPADGQGTGEIGDTLGGLLGPLLTAAALFATLKVAYEEGQRANRQFEDLESRSKIERAGKVVAWVGETSHDLNDSDDEYWHGVVVQNDSGLVVTRLDISVSEISEDDEKLEISNPEDDHGMNIQDRETIIPPGAWFIPFKAQAAGRPGEEQEANWQRIMPIMVLNGQMHVNMSLASTDRSVAQACEQTPAEPIAISLHTRLTIDSDDQPFYVVDHMRYIVGGQEWHRGTRALSGNASSDVPREDSPWTGWRQNSLDAAERNVRQNAIQPVYGSNQKTEPAVSNFLIETIRVLCGLKAEDDRAINKGAMRGYNVDCDNEAISRSGIIGVSLPTGKKGGDGSDSGSGKTSSRLRLHLSEGVALELTGIGKLYPKNIKRVDPVSAKIKAPIPPDGCTWKYSDKQLTQRAAYQLHKLSEGNRGAVFKSNERKGVESSIRQQTAYWESNMGMWLAILADVAEKSIELEKATQPDGIVSVGD
jgi:hypothetical protein